MSNVQPFKGVLMMKNEVTGFQGLRDDLKDETKNRLVLCRSRMENIVVTMEFI